MPFRSQVFDRRLRHRAQGRLEANEPILATARAAVPPWWIAERYGQSGLSLHHIERDTGFALGIDNALALTDRRILNFRTGFFGRIEGLRGELPLSRVRSAAATPSVPMGRCLTLDLVDGKPLTLVLRWQDNFDLFLEELTRLVPGNTGQSTP